MAYITISSRGVATMQTVSTWKEKFNAIRHLWVVAIILLSVMLSIYFGIATPTEAGAIGASSVLVLTLVTGKMSWPKFLSAVGDCISVSSMVLFLIVASAFFGRLLVVSTLSGTIVEALTNFASNRYIVFFFVAVLWFFLGMMIDAGGMMVISVPVVYPVMMALGFDPIWLGIICIKFCEMALITPPLGMAVFATSAVSGGIPVTAVYRGASRFLIMDIFTVILLTAFPEIVLFLPNLMM
jgi:TRAP-type C4-dicarboxylate transport system permease large subunit